MPDDLRARIFEALTNTPTAAIANACDNLPLPLTRHISGRGGHNHDFTCALCTGDVEALTDALMPVVEDAIYRAGLTDCCGQLFATHTMACEHYVGPVEHWKCHERDGVFCTCGWRWPEGAQECENTARWRGALPDRMPTRDEVEAP